MAAAGLLRVVPARQPTPICLVLFLAADLTRLLLFNARDYQRQRDRSQPRCGTLWPDVKGLGAAAGRAELMQSLWGLHPAAR